MYNENLNRKECSNIFNTRARMIQIKGNYTNMTCRWCNEDEETQIHISTAQNLNSSQTTSMKCTTIYYRDDNESTRATANTLQTVIEKIDREYTR